MASLPAEIFFSSLIFPVNAAGLGWISLSREEIGNAKLGQGGVISPPPVFIGVVRSQTFFACLQQTLDLLNLQFFRRASLQLQEVHMLAG